jgi:citrate synthase
MTQHTVTITDNASGKTVECPVLHGVYGDPVIDVKGLHGALGMFLHDPGFGTTASCRSAITFLDGDKGVLMHRGYPIEQLAEKSNFLEVSYLLIHGELPSATQMAEFSGKVSHHAMVHEHLNKFYNAYRYDAHPMSIMVGVMGAMASYYHDTIDIHNPADRLETAQRVIGKMPNLASNCYKYMIGRPFVYPDPKLGYVENFMKMMFNEPHRECQPSPAAIRALDLLFILHADHEQNASTSTVRLCASADTNPFACIAAGIATLWGKAHGGANEQVVRMLREIGDRQQIDKYIARAKDKNDPFRLMGFGHRVYKNYDPRAKIIRQACYDLLKDLNVNQPMFETAMELERIALEDEYFIERKLYPNVDFYSGLILEALGIPLTMFTVIFALARSSGWIAQWMELMEDPEFRIGRPRQLYIGQQQRDYVPMAARK